MNMRFTTTANRLADTYGLYYIFNLVKCVQKTKKTYTNEKKLHCTKEEKKNIKKASQRIWVRKQRR